MTLVVDRKRSWSSRRDWPAVDGRFRYVGRRSTAVRKGRAGRSSDLVRAKPRPTRKTFRDVGTGSFLSSGETATIPERFRYDSSVLARTFKKFRVPPPFFLLYIHIPCILFEINNRERQDFFFFFSFFLPSKGKKEAKNNSFSNDLSIEG